MIYLWNAMQYVRHHKLTYGLFVLQLIMIVLITNIFLSLAINLSKDLDNYADNVSVNILYLNGKTESESVFENFSLDQLESAQELVPNSQVALAKDGNLGLFDGENMHNYPFFEVAGDFFNVALSDSSMKFKEKTIYFPEQMLNYLQTSLELYPDFLKNQGINIVKINREQSVIITEAGEKIPYVVVSPSTEGSVLFADSLNPDNLSANESQLSQTVFLPMGANLVSEKEINKSLGILLSDKDQLKREDLVAYFNDQFPDYQFSFISLRQMLVEKEQGTLVLSRMVFAINLICIIIVLIGLLGFIATRIEQRKYDIAVCIIAGSTKKKMLIELFLEIFVVILTSAIVGIVLSYVLSQSVPRINGVSSTPSIMLSIMIIFSSFLISVMATLILRVKYVDFDSIRIVNGG